MSQSSFGHAEYYAEDGVKSNRVKPNSAKPIVIQKHKSISYTGGIAEVLLDSVVIPGNAMGSNGSLRIHAHCQGTVNANVKTISVYLAGVGINNSSLNPNLNNYQNIVVGNRGTPGSQFTGSYGLSGTSTSLGSVKNIDTTKDMLLEFKATLANAADTVSLESYVVEILPG
jgi:hypothetical protein